MSPAGPGQGGAGERPTGGPLTHLDDRGRARMVDVTGKPVTHRQAEARCTVRADTAALRALAADMVSAAGDARGAGSTPPS